MLKPATKFLNNTLDEQFIHIRQEFDEVREAKNDYKENPSQENKEHLIEELIDLQTGCETLLAILGLKTIERAMAQAQVMEKNRERGYYEESDK